MESIKELTTKVDGILPATVSQVIHKREESHINTDVKYDGNK